MNLANRAYRQFHNRNRTFIEMLCIKDHKIATAAFVLAGCDAQQPAFAFGTIDFWRKATLGE